MPATRLQDQAKSLSRYDVVGEDGKAPRFVQHVGLASRGIPKVRVNDSVPVEDSGLAGLERGRQMTAHVIGTANLEYGHIKQIENFFNLYWGEQQAERKRARREMGPMFFVILPHARPFEENGKTVCMRFSCAGFVIEAYRDAGIYLLDTDQATLPPVDRKTIGKVYPAVLRDSWAELNKECEWGLDDISKEKKTWPVVLPGYVLHALNREVTEIRDGAYKARLGDEVFPR